MRAAILPVLLLLAGCGGGAGPNLGPPPPITSRQSFSPAGLDAVLGKDATQLTRLFGAADADVREGTARKLQFVGPICVLDAYLYPRGSTAPVVTYLDAREPDGSPIDRASCVAALARRGGGR